MERFGRRLRATAQGFVDDGGQLPTIFDVQLTPANLNTLVDRFYQFLTSVHQHESAIDILQAVSAGDTRQLIRFARRIASHRELPVEALFRNSEVRTERFHPIRAMLEADHTAFAPDQDCPNLLYVDSPTSGDQQFLLQHRLLCLVDAGWSVDVRFTVAQLHILGCADPDIRSAFLQLHGAGLIEFTDTEKFTLEAPWPDQVLLTPAGHYHLHFLLRRSTYVLTIVSDVPLAHAVLRTKSPTSFLGRFDSLLEYTGVVAAAEDRQLRTLLSAFPGGAMGVVASMRRGGMLSDCLLAAIEDARRTSRSSDSPQVRALFGDANTRRRLARMEQRRRDLERRLDELENRMVRLSATPPPAGTSSLALGVGSRKVVAAPPAGGQSFHVQVQLPCDEPATDSAGDMIELAPGRNRSLGVLTIDREGDLVRLRLLDVTTNGIEANELGPWLDLTALLEVSTKWLRRIEVRVLRGESFADDLDAAGIALQELLLGETGRTILSHAVARAARLVVVGELTEVPWEWLRSSDDPSSASVAATTDVLRWAGRTRDVEQGARVIRSQFAAAGPTLTLPRTHLCVGLGRGAIRGMGDMESLAAAAHSIHLCGHHADGILELRTECGILSVEREPERDARLRRAVFDALPAAIANRFRRIAPDDFVIGELKLKILVKGSPFGVGVEGEAEIKFVPRVSGRLEVEKKNP